MYKLLLLMAFSGSMRAACILVDGNEIVARDLAAIDSTFSQLPAGSRFSYSPPVGSERIIPGAEIVRWASQRGIDLIHPEPICFERTILDINPAAIAAGIKVLFGEGGSQLLVEVVEICQCLSLRGAIEFSLTGVTAPPLEHPEKAVLWRGAVTTQTGATFPIWARARVLQVQTMVRAKNNIRPKTLLDSSQVEEVEVPMSPLLILKPQRVESYIGKVLIPLVKAGSLLMPGFVRVPPLISAGEAVKVDVVNGGTKLTIEAQAQNSGDRGDQITLLNPANLNRFQAVVVDPGRAQVLLAPYRHENQETEEKNTNDDGTVSKKNLSNLTN